MIVFQTDFSFFLCFLGRILHPFQEAACIFPEQDWGFFNGSCHTLSSFHLIYSNKDTSFALHHQIYYSLIFRFVPTCQRTYCVKHHEMCLYSLSILSFNRIFCSIGFAIRLSRVSGFSIRNNHFQQPFSSCIVHCRTVQIFFLSCNHFLPHRIVMNIIQLLPIEIVRTEKIGTRISFVGGSERAVMPESLFRSRVFVYKLSILHFLLVYKLHNNWQ